MTPPSHSHSPPPLVARGAAPTTNADLRARLAELVTFAAANDIDGFVAKVIPRDLEGGDDEAHFRQSLKDDDARWRLLGEEIARVDAGGANVKAISGDHVTRCEFRFEMPGEIDRMGCAIDREVEFMNYAAPGEDADWRATG